MKIDKLVGERFKEKPSDCVIDSHALMLRGGYMKNVANGIYSSFMPLRRITRKIENIIREEMDAIGGQEVQFPVVMPASLWNESGRYEAIGSELLKNYVGKTLRVLAEDEGKTPGTLSCRAEDNTIVEVAATPEMIGEFLQVRITAAMNWALRGERAE